MAEPRPPRNQEFEVPPDTMGHSNTIWFGTNEDKSEFFVDTDKAEHISKAEAFTRTGFANTEPVSSDELEGLL